MRRLIPFLVFLAACRGDQRSDTTAGRGAPSAAVQPGPDALVLRVPRRGGVARIASYSSLDSAVWTANDPAPPIDHVLAFDEDAGAMAFVDARGLPGRIDLRLGNITVDTHAKVKSLVSVDGSTIYGIGADGAVVRYTMAGNWLFKPPRPARNVFPQRDGSAIILGGRRDSATLWRVFPPDTRIRDSVQLPAVSNEIASQLGDRLYFVASGDALIGVRARTLEKGKPLVLDHPIMALAATPSGDRLFVVTESSTEISVVDRYQDRVRSSITLPGQPRDLRVDPFGRYLLVRAARGDSAWVIAIGTEHIIGSVKTAWRTDLPYVAADGAVALAQANDVAFVDGETLRDRRRVAGGATDFWYAFLWSGFRPRAAALDQPVKFPTRDSTDTAATPRKPVDSAVAAPAPVDTTPKGFVVSFAALLSESAARERASHISVRGESARVVASQRAGTTVYRVILGPFATKEEAERAGRESGQSYEVIEGIP